MLAVLCTVCRTRVAFFVHRRCDAAGRADDGALSARRQTAEAQVNWYERRVSSIVVAALRAALAAARRRLIAVVRYARWGLLSLAPAGTFTFDGRQYRYFRHPYNATWDNERAVEVPIVGRAIQEAGEVRILEVGNVLSHYFRHRHDIVDKYERGPGVVNVDILEYRPEQPYDLIISISTLEHVGWDEDVCDPQKIPRAVNHLRSMLASGGRALVTIPLGYNPYLDDMLRRGTLRFDRQYHLLRVAHGEWRQASRDVLGQPTYGQPFRGANALVIGVLERAA